MARRKAGHRVKHRALFVIADNRPMR